MIRWYSLTDLYPDCVLPNCPLFKQGQVHQHILPHQQAIHDSTAKYLYCQGGVGSAKSIAMAAKTVDLCLTIPGNEGVVSRKDFKLLYKSSWKDVKACIRRLVLKGLLDPDMSFGEQQRYAAPRGALYADKRQGDYTTIRFPNGSILYAMQGKNWSEGLGASYGLFWVDDAMESYEEMFVGDETSAGLLSRLRLPHVHYHRSSDGHTTSLLRGLVSSNPPPVGHWLHRLFGNKPGMYKIGDDTVEWMLVSTLDNPYVGSDYAKGLIAVQQKLGRNQNTARRVIFGESMPAYGGVPVFPQFDEAKHVAPLVYKPELPLVAGWDFGFHHPAVVFSNIYKCKYGTNHYFTLSEVTDCFSATVYQLYTDYVKPHIAALYKDAKLIVHAGDRAGYRQSSSNRDRRGDMKILIDEYHIPFKWRFLDLKNSLQYCRGLLLPKEPCKCGLQHVLISTKCPVLIGAMQGGYKFPKPRTGPVGEKPVEDRYFADVACAWRYAAENFVKWGVAKEDMAYLQQQSALDVRRGRVQTPYEWLEAMDKDFVRMITA